MKINFYAQCVEKGVNYQAETFFPQNLKISISRAKFKCPAVLDHCLTRALLSDMLLTLVYFA